MIRIVRCRDWRTLRERLAGDASGLILTPSSGASRALERALRDRLLAPDRPAAELPQVRTAAEALAELLLRADPPGTLATPLERSLLMESAVLAAADDPGAPKGNPLRLAGPLLRLFDEQARDRPIAPDRPAFHALLERARRTFEEARGTDEGAERLLRLTGWLESAHRGYVEGLETSGRCDLDLARRRLLARPPEAPWSRVRVGGGDAVGIADAEILATIVGGLDFLLLEDEAAPALPPGWTADEVRADSVAAPAPRLFVPGDGSILFRTTDRAGETRAAAAMLAGFGSYERCAVAARRPAAYADDLAAAGIPFQTDFQPSLAEEPWPAALDDALAFAEAPGRLSNGFALLRSPFFRDQALGNAPARLADVAEPRLAYEDVRDTHDPANLGKLVEPPEGDERRERELRVAARVLARLAEHARRLAPIQNPETPFHEAVECFVGFVEDCFPGGPEPAMDALRRAADPALPATPVGTPARFRDRVRRQLRRQRTVRYRGRDGVHLIQAEDAPFGDYDCVVLLGVGDADWPGPRAGNIFLPTRVLEDATRKRLSEARRRERRLLRAFATLPRKAAGFARAELEDGFPAGESPIFASLGEALGANPEERAPVSLPERIPDPAAVPLPRSLERTAPSAVDLGRWVSPSALTLYAANPAQFFLDRVLRLPREETLNDFGSAIARGDRVHKLLEAAPEFFRRFGPLTEATIDDALEFYRRRFRSSIAPGMGEDASAAEELWLFGGDSHPSALEWYLREEAERGPAQPVQVEGELDGIVEPATGSLPALHVRGKVDRVDRTPDGLRVVELKSGSSRGKDAARLQARLYARLVGADSFVVPFFKDRTWVGDDGAGEIDKRIREVRDGLAAGEFPARLRPFDRPLPLRPDLPDEPEPARTLVPGAPAPQAPPRTPVAFTPSDHAARRAAADPRRHAVLAASAGTGKTTVLTERYVNLIRAGVPPRNVLALTFTRKAAAEMKDRIVARLAQPEMREEWTRRPDLGEVQVSTLDAFNLGLIREFPLDAGVAPGAEVLDEREMPVVQAEAIGRVLTGATGFDRKLLAELPLLGKSLARLDGVAAGYLQNRLTWRRTFESRAAAGGAPRPRPALRDGFRGVEADARRILAGYDGKLPTPVRLALKLSEQAGSRDALDREALLEWIPLGLKTAPKHLKGPLRPVMAEYRKLRPLLREFNVEWLDSLNERTFDPVWRLLQAVEAEYQRLKEDRGVMDFDDLTVAATNLLGATGEFAESRFRLESRYHHLLLDEFQDTSDPQWELLRAIAEPWTSGEGLAAEEVRRVTGGRLGAPTLFVVGDHKQSIYRFRSARVEILNRTENWIRERMRPKTHPRLALRWNFRSTGPLRSFVNDTAAAIAQADREADRDWSFRYDDDDRFPEEAGPMDEGPAEEIPLSVAVAQDHDEAARRVAARIAALAARGVPLDRIAILARAASRLGLYRDAVERLGVPTYLVKGAGFFDSSEVLDLTGLCRFLARPSSDLRAVELLRSRFFAIPAGALAELRARDHGAATPFADLLNGRIEADGPLAEAGRVAPAWIKLSRQLPPSLALRRILEETGYLDRVRATGGAFEGRQQEANVEKALHHVQRVERSGFATFADAARHLESAGGDGHDATQAPLRAAGAVQVLTIHAAKGLEYDHVLAVDLNARIGGWGSGLRVQESDEGDWSIALIGDSSHWQVQDAGRSAAEERRCLYVAMTRARRSLTLSGVTGFKKDGAPTAAGGLAKLLPGDLWGAAAMTAKKPQPEIHWKRHKLKVLPPSASE